MATTKQEATAYHEAGHVLAFLLLNRKFKLVTIKPDGVSLGAVNHRKVSGSKFEASSVTNPDQLAKFFTHDFIAGAGFVAEKLFSRKNNLKGAASDFLQIYNSTLQDLPERFSQKYLSFLSEYTATVFELRLNRSALSAIALALIERETLSYDEVIKIYIEANKATLKIK